MMCILVKATLFVLTVSLRVFLFVENFVPEGSRILTRTSDGEYLPGKVANSEGLKFLVTLDNGGQIECSYEDRTVVVADSTPAWVTLGDHVIALSPLTNESHQYLTGFVTRIFCPNEKELYEVTLDNNHRGNYTLPHLRKLPFCRSAHEVGARVFARWKDNLYYRGFVKNQIHYGEELYIHVELDHLGRISHQASDERAIILDIIPSYSHVHATQRVIGHFPGYASYFPGVVVRRNEDCWQGAYHVQFDTGEERQLDFNEIRILPPYVQLVF